MTAFIDTDDLTVFTGADASGELGDFACSAASQIVEDFLDNGLVLETEVTARLDGTGTDALVLPRPPVRVVTSVTECDVELAETDDYWLSDAGILYRVCGRWPVGRGNVVVQYDRGFDLGPYPGGEMLIPDDIKLVALALAKRIAASGTLPVGGFTGETIGNYSYSSDPGTISKGVFELHDGEKSILAKYQDATVR